MCYIIQDMETIDLNTNRTITCLTMYTRWYLNTIFRDTSVLPRETRLSSTIQDYNKKPIGCLHCITFCILLDCRHGVN